MGTLLGNAAWFALAGLVMFGCSSNDDPDVLLVVEAAQTQPTRDDLGVIVAIQSKGGRWLELSVNGGTLGGPACLPAPTADLLISNVTEAIVFPEQTEAVLTVKLLPDGPKVASVEAAAGATGEPEPDEVGPCGIAASALITRIQPVQRVSASTAPGAADTGGAPAGGTTGSAGASEGGASESGRAGGAGTAGAGGDSADGGEPETGDAGPESGAGG